LGSDLILGIMGDPVDHSLSPKMHNAALRHLRLSGIYTRFRVTLQDLSRALDSVRCLGIRGVNLTMPLKQEALRFLDSIDGRAGECGAVNTVLNEKGYLKGFNTDVDGFIDSLKETPRAAVVLGSGGAASAVLLALSDLGSESIVMGRTREKVELLARKFGARPMSFDLRALTEVKWDLLVNATPLGMRGFPDLEIPVEALKPGRIVFDLVYSPRETTLLKLARRRGCRVIEGLELLVNQGARSFRLWTGMEPPLQVMREAVGLEGRG